MISDRVKKLALLTPAEAAVILRVKPHTLAVWRCEKRYDLPYVKSGSRVGYRVCDLEQFIERRTRRLESLVAER